MMLTSGPRLVVLSSLLALAACSGAPGEQTAEQGQAMNIGGPGPGTGFLIVPTRYSVSPSQAVKMLPSATNYCVLDGVSGILGGEGPFVVPNVDGAQSFADIFDDGTDFWLISGVGVNATASCISWSNFSGPGVVPSEVQTTTRAPYWTVAESGNGSNVLKDVSMWASSACVLQSLQGQWSGVVLGPAAPFNGVAVSNVAPAPLLDAFTNSPYLVAGANCVLFPGRPSGVTTSTYGLGPAQGAPSSVALPSRTSALCGLASVGGVFAGDGDSFAVVPEGTSGQTASFTGRVQGGTVTCMPYAQP